MRLTEHVEHTGEMKMPKDFGRKT